MSTIPAVPQIRRSITDVIYVVADHYGVSPSEILGRSRLKTAAEARIVAYGLSRDLTRASGPEIASVFGREQSTIFQSVASLARRMRTDESLARSVAVCRARALETIRARRMVP